LELDRQGIRTKINGRRRSGGICFGTGSLAHLLKNRFYIGDVVYRGGKTNADRELIDRHVARVIIKPQALEVCLVPTGEEQVEDPSVHDPAPDPAPCHPPTTINASLDRAKLSGR
jgi:hypothetical protein